MSRNTNNLRDNRHWSMPHYKQRMTHEEWATLLLNFDDTMIYQGVLTKLVARDLGYGVVEVYKEGTE